MGKEEEGQKTGMSSHRYPGKQYHECLYNPDNVYGWLTLENIIVILNHFLQYIIARRQYLLHIFYASNLQGQYSRQKNRCLWYLLSALGEMFKE